MLRQARRAAHWALEKLGDVKMEDVGVPRSRVPDMLRAIEAIAAKHDVRIGTFGHAGDGNLHPDLVLERGDPRGEVVTKAVQADLYRAALDLGGTVTGEHGIGSARREWLEEQRGADAVRVMRAIKTRARPAGPAQPREGAALALAHPFPRATHPPARSLRMTGRATTEESRRRRGDPIGRGPWRSPVATPEKEGSHPPCLPRKLAAFGTAVVALTIGVAPILTNAADHLDAPALGGATANGQIAPHSEHGDRDINDVYVFRAPDNANRTVIAMTVNPAINLFGGNFGTNVRYIVNVDKNGDNKADLAYVARFGRVDRDERRQEPGAGLPDHEVHRVRTPGRSSDGTTVAWGESNGGNAKTRYSLRAWAGVRSDPFFFDLTGFIGTTTKLKTGTAVGGDALGNHPTDFFANLNTNAIVLSIPNSQLPDTIGVWATTQYRQRRPLARG